jgi:hypothetical protein
MFITGEDVAEGLFRVVEDGDDRPVAGDRRGRLALGNPALSILEDDILGRVVEGTLNSKLRVSNNSRIGRNSNR